MMGFPRRRLPGPGLQPPEPPEPPATPVTPPEQASAGAGAPSATPGAEGAARSTPRPTPPSTLRHTIPPAGGSSDRSRQASFQHPVHRCTPQWPCDSCLALTDLIGEHKALEIEHKALEAELDAECVARRHDGALFVARIHQLEERVRRLEDRKARRWR